MCIYLDSTSTAIPKKEVIDTVKSYLDNCWFNPSALYATKVKKDIEKVRSFIKCFIGANEKDKIIFTSGASESNNMAIKGFYKQMQKDGYMNRVVFTTSIEHNSILKTLKSMWEVDYNNIYHTLPVYETGRIKIDELKNHLKLGRKNGYTYPCFLVTTHMVNNEIGTIQDIKALSSIVHEYGGILHVDATQALGKIDIDVDYLGIDMLSASGHKIGTPKGIGILYIKDGIEIAPLIDGEQEFGLRGGTENVSYIMAFGKALELFLKDSYYQTFIPQQKRAYMIEKIKEVLPNCIINGHPTFHSAEIISLTYPNKIDNERLVYMLSTDGIFIATGSACNSHKKEPSRVLKSIGLSDEEINRTIRISLGENISFTDIDKAVERIYSNIKLLEEIDNMRN